MRVLIVRVGAMGDILHALPAVASLRAVRPDWQIDWVADPRWRPLLVNDGGSGPVVGRVHLADTQLWSRSPASLTTLRSIASLRTHLRARRYDIAVDMQGTLRSAVITRLSGTPVRVGYADPRERPAAWFYTRELPRRATHVVDQASGLLSQALDIQALELALPSAPTPLPSEPWADTWADAEAGSGRLALLAAGAGWAAKQWPTARFAALARALKGEGFDVAVTAPRKDNETALRVVAESSGSARLAVSNISGLIALTRRAALVIGGDSGPSHLAAALGVPLVALFGPTDPARNGPWGPGPIRVLRDPTSVTSYRHTVAEDPGLRRLSVEQVLGAAIEVSTP